ncbi:MAG: HesA/MoeB/ThiF family protein [Lachnospiraceae bacterium]|jgi:molybdopterin/thiamine biosynthesis adenylyltransferase
MKPRPFFNSSSEDKNNNANIRQEFSLNVLSVSLKELKSLEEKSVLIVGCDEFGGTVSELLARAGVGRIVVMDNEKVKITDVYNELLANAENIGKLKVFLAEDRLRLINPGMKNDFWVSEVRSSTVEAAVSGKDAVIASIREKEKALILENACEKKNIPLIMINAYEWSVQVIVSVPGSKAIERFLGANELPEFSSTPGFTASTAASLASAEALKALTGRKSAATGMVINSDLDSMRLEVISPDEVCVVNKDIRITINKFCDKQEITVRRGTSIAELADAEGFDPNGGYVFITRNTRLVRAAEYSTTIVEEGDLIGFQYKFITGG